jgi:3-hydroxyacyl-[acyl-carrier-protein] dehydratase
MPVVPGVCQTQIIKEVLQNELGLNLTMTKGDNIKFTGMIIPTQHPAFSIELKYKKDDLNYIVEASLFFENTIFTKFKGTFIQN